MKDYIGTAIPPESRMKLSEIKRRLENIAIALYLPNSPEGRKAFIEVLKNKKLEEPNG